MDGMEKEERWQELGPTRRMFIRFTVFSTAMAAIAGIIYPLVKYLFPSGTAREEKREAFKIPMNEIHVGEARFFKFKRKPAILIRKNERDVVAMSAVCTHLGCIVKFSERDMTLKCPCHGGIFDINGKVVAGPPPTPLEVYSTTIEGGQIFVEEA